MRLHTVVVGLALLSLPPQANSPPTSWIRDHAIPLTTVEAGHGFADLQALKPLIGEARIVALGEATHGTREFFQLKHRMLEFLASEMGFTIFSIEANLPEAYRLNDYVLDGTGDPEALLKGMYFWTWNTDEVLDMIRWMRAFNASGKGRVQFTGFDCQVPAVALENARQFVAKYDAGEALAWSRLSQRVTRVTKPQAVSDEAKAIIIPPVIQDMQEFLDHLQRGRAVYIERHASDREVTWALQNVRIVIQGLQDRAGAVDRDLSMAANVKWILDQNPGAKVVLWAHNLHVAAASGPLSESMGSVLRQMYGPQMFTFGFAFDHGSFQAISQDQHLLKGFTVPTLPGGFDAALASAGLPMFALDLRTAPAWFSEPRRARNIGSVYPEGKIDAFSYDIVAPKAYDAVLFVESTTAAHGR